MTRRRLPTTKRVALLAGLAGVLPAATAAHAQTAPLLVVELEAGPVWPGRLDVQVPNDSRGTRFSLLDITGDERRTGWRVLMTLNIDDRNGVRVMLAPFSLSGTSILDQPVLFAGGSYDEDELTWARYAANVFRLSYRHRLLDAERAGAWVGLTANVRDVSIAMEQVVITSRRTELAFDPLVHLAADLRLGNAWRLGVEGDAIARGGDRLADAALKLRYEPGASWVVAGGYRITGSRTTDEAAFTSFLAQSGVLSVAYRF